MVVYPPVELGAEFSTESFINLVSDKSQTDYGNARENCFSTGPGTDSSSEAAFVVQLITTQLRMNQQAFHSLFYPLLFSAMFFCSEARSLAQSGGLQPSLQTAPQQTVPNAAAQTAPQAKKPQAQPIGETIAKKLAATIVTIRYSCTKANEGSGTYPNKGTNNVKKVAPNLAAGANGSATTGGYGGVETDKTKPIKKRTPKTTPNKKTTTATNTINDCSVSVCSGTCVGPGLFLTFACPMEIETNARGADFRITLPSGLQAKATPSVIDIRSGLILLRTDSTAASKIQPLTLAKSLPNVGASVLTSAASGLEEPLFSRGVLSAKRRSLVGSPLPPLLVCDISTTTASSGAALVDANANLIGIIAVTSAPGERFGWSYAISKKHIERVLNAEVPDSLVVLHHSTLSPGCILALGKQKGLSLLAMLRKMVPPTKRGYEKATKFFPSMAGPCEATTKLSNSFAKANQAMSLFSVANERIKVPTVLSIKIQRKKKFLKSN